MKQVFLIALACMATGCGVFRNIDKKTNEQKLEQVAVSESQSQQSDSSKRLTTEHWRLVYPGIERPSLPAWQPGPMPDLSGVTKEMANAYMELRNEYGKLSGQQFNNGYGAAMLEFTKTMQENLHQNSSESKRDTVWFQAAQKSDEVHKDAVIPGWVWGLVIVLVLLNVISIIAQRRKA